MFMFKIWFYGKTLIKSHTRYMRTNREILTGDSINSSTVFNYLEVVSFH